MNAAPLSAATYLHKFAARHATREWRQTLLILAILSLAIATFLSIRIANRAALAGFDLFTSAIGSPADLSISATSGPLPVDRLASLRAALDPLPVTLIPVIESNLTHPDLPPASAFRSVRLLGIDVQQVNALAPPPAEGDWQLASDSLWDALRDPAHLFLADKLAAAWQVKPGEHVELILRGQPARFTVAGILPAQRGTIPTPENLAVIDFSALLPRLQTDAVDRVDVIVAEGEQAPALLAAAQQRLATLHGLHIQPGNATATAGGKMTAAFRMNLFVLSLIALLTAIILTAQALDALVSRRRTEIATLRSMGIEPRQIRRLWTLEAMFYGAVAALCALPIGLALSQFTTHAVLTTVSALYQQTARNAIGLTAGDAAAAAAIGLLASLCAAWIPARDAAATPPAQFLRLQVRIPPFPLFQRTGPAIACLALAAACLALPPIPINNSDPLPIFAFLSAILALLGGTRAAVSLLPFALKLFRHSAHPSARMAAARLQSPSSRHQLAVAGFFVTLSMAASMAFLIQSFESTVSRWLDTRLQADLFISANGFSGGQSDQRMPAALLTAIAAAPNIATIAPSRTLAAPTDAPVRSIQLMHPRIIDSLLWLKAPPKVLPETTALPAFANESALRRAGIDVGSEFTIASANGPLPIVVTGIFSDYATDQPAILLPIALAESTFNIATFDTASIWLTDPAQATATQERLQAAFPGLTIRNNPQLRTAALGIFHQTFAVTHALQAIGLLVALTGLVLTILTLLRDNAAEIRVQRILGMSNHQIAASACLEGLAMAASGLLGGLLMSLALGGILIFFINPQSFGWTLQPTLPLGDFATLAAATLLTAAVTAYSTARLALQSALDKSAQPGT